MTPVIFLDMDEMLLHSKGDEVIPRPGVFPFLEDLAKMADLYLLSAGSYSYIKGCFDVLRLDRWIQDFYSARLPNNFLPLVQGKPFLLIDDLPFDHINTQVKLKQIHPLFSEDHLLQVPQFKGDPKDRGLSGLLSQVQERLKTLSSAPKLASSPWINGFTVLHNNVGGSVVEREKALQMYQTLLNAAQVYNRRMKAVYKKSLQHGETPISRKRERAIQIYQEIKNSKSSYVSIVLEPTGTPEASLLWKGSQGQVYRVSLTPRKISCTCEDAKRSSVCKHRIALSGLVSSGGPDGFKKLQDELSIEKQVRELRSRQASTIGWGTQGILVVNQMDHGPHGWMLCDVEHKKLVRAIENRLKRPIPRIVIEQGESLFRRMMDQRVNFVSLGISPTETHVVIIGSPEDTKITLERLACSCASRGLCEHLYALMLATTRTSSQVSHYFSNAVLLPEQ